MNIKAYLTAAVVGAWALSACQNDFDDPALNVPEASIQANTSIYDVKLKYWDDARNYIDTIGLTDDGQHVIIAGRVVSSDASGNIYKNLVIQDGTAALTISVNANSLYNKYRIGQEVVMDLTDMYIGKYNGLQQLGFPEWYAAGQAWEATFMPYEFFEQHSELNGLPEPDAVQPAVITYADINTQTAETLCKWQSRLVRFDNCYFENGGKDTFTPAHKENGNQNLMVWNGTGYTAITVRTSGYSNFWSRTLPEGHGSVVGILGYYGEAWQLTLRSIDDLIGFAQEDAEGSGTKDDPYTVGSVINFETQGIGGSGWVKGYIVGAVNAGVTSVTSNSDIQFKADVDMPNTLVIASAADVTDFSRCLVIELPSDSPFRQYGNLADNPSNYGKAIAVQGTFGKVLNTWGVTGNTGAWSEFQIEGVSQPSTPDTPSGEVTGQGTKENPYTVADVRILGATGAEAWVKGVIVGYVEGDNLASQAKFTNSADRASNIIIAPTASETNPAKCIAVSLKTGSDARKALNLMDNPGVYGQTVTLKGSLRTCCGAPGVFQPSEFQLGGSSVDPSEPSTPDTPATGEGSEASPYNVSSAIAKGETAAKVWVSGYIVGYVNGNAMSKAEFTGSAERASNVLIADSPEVTDASKCMAVELKSGSKARKALNLIDNPGVYKTRVSLEGNIATYMGAPGVRNVSNFKQ